ncbi:hypothetical protein QZH41_017212 [Actinostola sp. cb2023]|nr:hypothetical protein QZH41_017212 [Actinostola sp. cb2023]
MAQGILRWDKHIFGAATLDATEHRHLCSSHSSFKRIFCVQRVGDRISALRILYVVSILDALSIMGQLWFVLRHETTPYLAVFLLFLLQHVVLGAQTTPVFCLILTYSQQQHSTHQATQHSFYTTLETMGSTLSLFLAGLLAEHLGYTSGLCISLIVAVAFVVVVGHGTEKLEHRKKEE